MQFILRNIIINKTTVRERLEEYAATYLLDRQEANWTYDLTRKQCSKHCIIKEFENDKEEFVDLLGEVVDRYRGRIKKELQNLYFE